MKIRIAPVPYRITNGEWIEVLHLTIYPPNNNRVEMVWAIFSDASPTSGVFTELERGVDQMTADEWTNWPAGDDNNYAERIVATHLNLTQV